MASLKALKIRIGSVKSTQKITKAMKMVAAAKLRRAQQAAEAGRPYAERMEKVMASLAGKVAISDQSPKLLAGTGRDQNHLLVVCTSDRGLAGAFNSNIVRAARRQAEELIAQGKTVYFYLVGRKGRAVIQRLYPKQIVHQHDTSAIKQVAFADAQATAYAPGDFLTGHDDAVGGKKRLAAYVFGLTPVWRVEWGGLLLFHGSDGDVDAGLAPRFNTLNVFAVPQTHSVSMVTRAAPSRRYSITGWLRAR